MAGDALKQNDAGSDVGHAPDDGLVHGVSRAEVKVGQLVTCLGICGSCAVIQ